MSSRVLKKLIAMLEAEEAEAWKSENHGSCNAFNNQGSGDQNFSNAKINSRSNSGDRMKYNTTNNHGKLTVNNSGTFNGNGNGGYTEGIFDAFNNHGSGDQNFSNAKINRRSNSGDQMKYHTTTNNHGGRTVNNSGTFNGNGNGWCYADNFDVSTKNYKF